LIEIKDRAAVPSTMTGRDGDGIMLEGIKSVFIAMDPEAHEQTSSALGYGLSLARQAGAHATIHTGSIKFVLTHPFVGKMTADLVAAENRRTHMLAKAAAERARGEAATAGVACSTESVQLPYHELLSRLVAQARVHDFSILDAMPGRLPADRGLIDTLLFESGRPIILVPPECDSYARGRVLIAWDGSARAARAVNDAMPLLRAAEAVEIVSVTGEKDLSTTVPGAEVAPHLARHGISATVNNLTAQDGDVATTLTDQAGIFRANLIVMGGYVHSRLRQFIFGGVTRSMIESSPVPLFMSY
jgi:nucleotide-binding universal stress UspA family protein